MNRCSPIEREHLFIDNVKTVPRSERQPIRSALPRGQGELLRGELVAAATELLLAPQDVAPPSLRAIARHVGVVPSAVYRHFDSAEALTAVVVAEQFDAPPLRAPPGRRSLKSAPGPVAQGRRGLLPVGHRASGRLPAAVRAARRAGLHRRAARGGPVGAVLRAAARARTPRAPGRRRGGVDVGPPCTASPHCAFTNRRPRGGGPWRTTSLTLITALEPRPAPPRPHQPPPVSS